MATVIMSWEKRAAQMACRRPTMANFQKLEHNLALLSSYVQAEPGLSVETYCDRLTADRLCTWTNPLAAVRRLMASGTNPFRRHKVFLNDGRFWVEAE